jgi:hypothetical protein
MQWIISRLRIATSAAQCQRLDNSAGLRDKSWTSHEHCAAKERLIGVHKIPSSLADSDLHRRSSLRDGKVDCPGCASRCLSVVTGAIAAFGLRLSMNEEINRGAKWPKEENFR